MSQTVNDLYDRSVATTLSPTYNVLAFYYYASGIYYIVRTLKWLPLTAKTYTDVYKQWCVILMHKTYLGFCIYFFVLFLLLSNN